MDGVNKTNRKKVIFFLFFLFLVAAAASLYFFSLFKALTIKKPFPAVKEIQQKIFFRKTINNMSLEEKAAQLMFIGAASEEWEQLGDWKYSAGGLIISSKLLKEEIENLKLKIASQSGIIPFVGVDQEGGVVCRFDWLDCTSQKQIKNHHQAFMIAKTRGEDLKKLGINVVFAPVLDIAESENDFIWERTFDSNDENKIADLGSAMIKGFSEAGIIACPKHFPGHGGTSIDSHLQLPSIECGRQCLEKRICPFKKAIDNGAEMIMVGHIILTITHYPSPITHYPTSISKYWITEVLRGDLGFKGVVVTDDLLMRSLAEIDYPETENIDKAVNFWWAPPAAVESIKAGADMVMIVGAPEVQEKVFQRLKKAVDNKEISKERIDESLEKVLKLKSSLTH